MLPVFERSITDIDQRICPTVVQTGVSRGLAQSSANDTSEECEWLGETQQLFACPVNVETVPNKIWNQKGSLNIATSPSTPELFARKLDARPCRVRPACRRHNCRVSRRHHCRGLPMPQARSTSESFVACHNELIRRIEDAAKNQTARDPESTVLFPLLSRQAKRR